MLHGLRARQIRKGDLDYNVLRVPLTQQDIADTIGLTNVSISRLFTKLEAIGCVRFERHVITILDYDLMMAQTAGLSDDFNPVDEFD